MALEIIDPGPTRGERVREYILDMLDQLANMAAETGDHVSAQTIWSCWSAIGREWAPAVDAAGSDASDWLASRTTAD